MSDKPKRDRRGYTPPIRRNKSKPNAFFGVEVRDAIREVAVREGVQVQNVVAEALRDVMRKHGVEPPAELEDQYVVSGASEVKAARPSIRPRRGTPQKQVKRDAPPGIS